jgi:cell division transport system ATP-binding protein
VIEFSGVTAGYGRGGAALRGVTFGMGKGEFAFLTGPSGAGKSTLLKLAYFDAWPTEGEVRVAGFSSRRTRHHDVPLVRRRLGVVFQSFRLLHDRTAEQNVAFALEVTGAPHATIRERAARALEQVGLAGKGTRLPRELSGGEQQRVAIARALVNQPLVLLADEPTGNLDERASRGVFQLLRDINAAGTAVLMATHNLELVRDAGARVLELDRGRLVGDSARPALPRPDDHGAETRA